MKALALLLLCLFTSLASANDNKENASSSLLTEPEAFELKVTFQTPINGNHSVKTAIEVGKPFEEKLTLADDAYLEIKGTLQPAVGGEYPIQLFYTDWKSNYATKGSCVKLKLTPDKYIGGGTSAGLVHLYSAIITRTPRVAPKQTSDAVASPSAVTTTGSEFAAELPSDAQVKREKPVWGEEVDGLQLGISLDYLNRPYAIGETAAFTLVVRNVGKQPVKLTYSKPDWAISPKVTDEKGGPLSVFQQITLLGPAYNLPGYSAWTIVAPNQVFEVARAWLAIGPSTHELNPALDVTPGKYQVRYSYHFYQDINEDKSTTLKSWEGDLMSGMVMLEVVPAQKKD